MTFRPLHHLAQSVHNFIITTLHDFTITTFQANSITCMCVSEDTRWLAAADCGKNNMIIVWDTATR